MPFSAHLYTDDTQLYLSIDPYKTCQDILYKCFLHSKLGVLFSAAAEVNIEFTHAVSAIVQPHQVHQIKHQNTM